MRRAFRVDWKGTTRSEEDVVGEICAYLTLRHIPFIRTHNSRRRPLRPGTPDIVGALPKTGRCFQVEVKDEDGVVSAEQAEVMREFGSAGALVFVARSVQDVADQIDAAQRAGAIVMLDGGVIEGWVERAGKRR